MRIAVIADIHSNYMALENALCRLDGLRREGTPIDAMIFLGDYVTDFPYPQNTLRLLDECRAEFPCYFVRGNREDYLIRHRENPDDGWRYSSSSGSLLYTFENLSGRDLDDFAAMPVCLHAELGGEPAITACHGSPSGTKEWIMNRPQMIEHCVAQLPGNVLLCGHTHRQGVVECGRKRVIFCPSLGLPQDKRPGSKFLLLEPHRGVWRYRTMIVDYDKQAMINEFRQSGLLDKAGVWARCIIRSMLEERDLAARCVALAWRHAAADNYTGNSVLPEHYWEAAARELAII